MSTSPNKYKGVRRRKWGKWVSEIRVPASQERLWLGTYSTPEGAAVAHDVAFYCLRGVSSPDNLNFPLMLPSSVRDNMSPKSVQRAASDAGMAIDAQMIASSQPSNGGISGEVGMVGNGSGSGANYGNVNESRSEWDGLSISVDDYLQID